MFLIQTEDTQMNGQPAIEQTRETAEEAANCRQCLEHLGFPCTIVEAA